MRSCGTLASLRAVLTVLAVAVSSVGAQPTGALRLAERGPHFYLRTGPDGRRVDQRNAAVLQRHVAVDLRAMPVGAAIDEIGRVSGMVFTYDPNAIASDTPVTFTASNVTVEAALTVVLLNRGIDVELTGPERATLVKRDASTVLQERPAVRQARVAIVGRVYDAVTRAPIARATVRIDNPERIAVAGADGRYAIDGLPSGTYRLTARRLGYVAADRTVQVGDDSTTTHVDFAMNAMATRLDEVVTTAVGAQRRYEVGNTIATLNVDSIASAAPITTATDLLSARAPGVEVMETGGLTGSGEAIRIRGLTSIALQNDPILIVDGVRQDNAPGGDISASRIGSGDHPTPSRLNDLDFNDIATIDILKGPAAATEYGTDAANGVIVITTKHGHAGHPEWRIAAEQSTSAIPESFPNGYYSWGHTTLGPPTVVNCPQVALPGALAVTNGNCAVDSVTRWNPLNHPRYSIFGSGDRQKYDLSVNGGSDAVRYFVSGGLTNERGIVQMPEVFQQLATNAGVTPPGAASDANTENQRSLRANTAMRLGSTADLSATATYLSTYQRTPETGLMMLGVLFGPALRDSAHSYGYGGAGVTPLGILGNIGDQRTDRFVGGLTANWRPASWLEAHATVGLDHGSQRQTDLVSPAIGPYALSVPSLGQETGTSDLYSADLRATAQFPLSSSLRSNTSFGLQLVDDRSVGQTATATGITATNETLNGYSNTMVTQLSDRAATLGGYGEEQLTIANRLFLTGALRLDAGSGFGSTYHTALYPKASVSYLALQSGATSLRLRGAFGEAGVQPSNGASFQLYQLTPIWSGGGAVSGTQLTWPGNSALRPERTYEFEGGADLGLWGNRVSLEVSGYAKRTQDLLVNANLGFDLGSYPYQENVGTVQNNGVEGTLTAALIQTRALTWDITLNAAFNHNRLLALAPGVGAQIVNLAYAQFRQVPGYPLYGLWARRTTYADRNHDGIIETNEITVADSASYLGSSQPTQEASVSTQVGLWHGLVTINALADYRGGYRILNLASGFEDFIAKNQREGNDPTAPLASQARYAAAQIVTLTGGSSSAFVEDGTFVRFRELGVTVALPQRLARVARVSSLSLTGAVRNLALWTRYPGVDPEVTSTLGSNIRANPTTGGSIVNNDVRADYGAVPLARYWILRLTAGL